MTGEIAEISRLAHEASLEMSVHDIPQLEPSRELLVPGTRMYVSHLPRQQWSDTVRTCIAARNAGCDAIPHVPARCIEDRAAFEHFVDECATRAKVRELLIIAGDYPASVGPFDTTMDVLRSGILPAHGILRLSVAGHPEGHPNVSDAELRRAVAEKVVYAESTGTKLTFLTQFFFDAAPFIAWRRQLQIDPQQIDSGRVRTVAGLAGPAKLSTLLRYAVKCGVGASIRKLGARPGSFAQLLGERSPDTLVRALAGSNAKVQSGIHLFSFGGLLRTCAWLAAVRAGRFNLDDNGGFSVRERI